MRYRRAKKLRTGAHITMKRMDAEVRVTAVRWDDKVVTLEVTDEFNCTLELTHLDVK